MSLGDGVTWADSVRLVAAESGVLELTRKGPAGRNECPGRAPSRRCGKSVPPGPKARPGCPRP